MLPSPEVMSKPSYSTVTLDVEPGAKPLPVESRSDTRFRILLLGDFSGRRNRGEPPPERLRPYLIDRDTLDEVLYRMRPALAFGAATRGLVLRFRELEAFHPDSIYRQDVFQKFREAPPFASAQPAVSERSMPAPPPPVEAPLFSGGSLLDSIVETTEGQPARHPDPLRDFIARAVAPHTSPPEDPRIAESTAKAAAEAGTVMRALLHHPDFQALEAAWRAVDWLVRGLETGPLLKIYVLDIAKGDLAGSLPELRRILVDDAAVIRGAEPWSLIAANFNFARTGSDIRLLSALAAIARAAGAVLLAEADPSDADSEEAERDWQALRKSPEAASVGLALPRFLLRLPYGKETHTVEAFPFEEMPGGSEHSAYLWGNPAFACAYLLGQAFSSDGWDMLPGTHSLISGLPLHLYQADGESQIKPCAELLLSDADAESILDQGLMPLVSIKNQDAVRLLRFQSIAEPAAALSGAWT